MSDLYIKDLISKKYKHLLYRDESPELTDFLILNYAEVYRTSETELKLLILSPKKASTLQKMGVISEVWVTDDQIYISTTDNQNLGKIIELGSPSKRIYKAGKKLKVLEEKLGHKIIPFNPKLPN